MVRELPVENLAVEIPGLEPEFTNSFTRTSGLVQVSKVHSPGKPEAKIAILGRPGAGALTL